MNVSLSQLTQNMCLHRTVVHLSIVVFLLLSHLSQDQAIDMGQHYAICKHIGKTQKLSTIYNTTELLGPYHFLSTLNQTREKRTAKIRGAHCT